MLAARNVLEDEQEQELLAHLARSNGMMLNDLSGEGNVSVRRD